MKKYFIILILSIIVFFTCNKEEELPKITQEGKDTFGMMVDGKVWLPYRPGIFMPGNRTPNIYYYKKGNLLYFYIKNFNSDEIFYFTISNVTDKGIYFANPNLFKSITDSLNFYCQDTTRFETNWDCNSSFKLRDSSLSFINITFFDTTKKIVSGFFEMELINNHNKILKITEGGFDSHFIFFNH